MWAVFYEAIVEVGGAVAKGNVDGHIRIKKMGLWLVGKAPAMPQGRSENEFSSSPGLELCFFFVGVNLEGDLDAFTLGGGLEHAADGGCGKAIPADEHGDIFLREDELEAEFFRSELGDFQLSLGGVIDEADGDELQKIS